MSNKQKNPQASSQEADENTESTVESVTDKLKDTDLGLLISSCLYKLEHISDHHVQERRRNFRVTNLIVGVISAFILIIAVFNLYYIYDFYMETMKIVNNIHDLDDTVKIISSDMQVITQSMTEFNKHMSSMQGITQDVQAMSGQLPLMQQSLGGIYGDMSALNRSMGQINQSMLSIDNDLKHMSGNVGQMGRSIYEMSVPMSKFNSVLP